MKLVEEKIQFDFSEESWSYVAAFDKTAFYLKVKDALEETKGIDFSGIFEKNSLVLMEVKDFRQHRIETKPRVEGKEDPIWLEVAKKMKDSVAVMVGASRNATNDAEAWKSYHKLMQNEKKKIHLILWIEQDLPLNTSKSRQNRELNDRYLLRRLKNTLHRLTTKVDVANISSNPFPNSLNVSYL